MKVISYRPISVAQRRGCVCSSSSSNKGSSNKGSLAQTRECANSILKRITGPILAGTVTDGLIAGTTTAAVIGYALLTKKPESIESYHVFARESRLGGLKHLVSTKKKVAGLAKKFDGVVDEEAFAGALCSLVGIAPKKYRVYFTKCLDESSVCGMISAKPGETGETLAVSTDLYNAIKLELE